MNQRKAKLLRKVFKDRKQYRRMKQAYTRGTEAERIRASKALIKIKRGGKIHRLEIDYGSD